MDNLYYNLYSNYRKFDYYYYYLNLDLVDIPSNISVYYDVYERYFKEHPILLKACEKMYNRQVAKNKRLRKRIQSILNNERCLFLTFTFTDDVLDLKSKTRHDYVKRFLKLYCDDYVANIDFGAVNGREHYHAVVSSDFEDWQKNWQYGAINFKVISPHSNAIQLAHYVNKLVNHAKKVTAGNIIYSRKSKKI